MTDRDTTVRNPETAAYLDASRYPRHVPTINEQIEHEGLDVDPDQIETKGDISRFTSIGVFRNPFAFRARLEDAYIEDTPTKRMERDGGAPTTAAQMEYGIEPEG